MGLKERGARGSLRNVSVDAPVIPDSENLQARYDARELSLLDGESVTTWPDESGNGNDLNVGTGDPTYRANSVAGLPSVEFTDDRMETTFGSQISTPYSVFYLGRYNSLTSGTHIWTTDPIPGSGLVGHMPGNNYDGWQYKVNGGSNQDLQGGEDTNNHIWTDIIDSSSQTSREDGTNEIAASTSASNLDGIAFGGRVDGAGNSGEQELVEILVYSVDESGTESDIESYLNRDTNIL